MYTRAFLRNQPINTLCFNNTIPQVIKFEDFDFYNQSLFLSFHHVKISFITFLTLEFLLGHPNEFETYFVVVIMPLEVCKLSRSSRSKIHKEYNTPIIETTA
jgi:hypothetical protein